MSESKSTTIIVAIIGAVATIVSGIGGAAVGNNNAQDKQNEYIQSHTVNIEGNDNSVNINDVNDLVNEYNNLLSENETLKAKNTSYFNDLTDTKNQLELAENVMKDVPQITYNNLGLVLDAQDVSINKNNSMITVNGREYFSKEITEKLLPANKSMTIKDGRIYVGKVVADKANLMDKWVIEEKYYETQNSLTDSLGNTHTNCILLNCVYSSGNVTYNVENKYSMLKATISVGAGTSSNTSAFFSIEADGQTVYTYDNLNIHTQPFEIDVPINNCTELKISCTSNCKCIISEAILYN